MDQDDDASWIRMMMHQDDDDRHGPSRDARIKAEPEVCEQRRAGPYTPTSKIQETAVSVQMVPGLQFPVVEFAV
eukprot:3941280-Rhodomonas_salina.3